MNDETLWTRIHDALDRRGDPLADREVLAALAERPEALAELLELRAALGRVALAAGDRPARPARRAAAAIAAGLLAAAALSGMWPRFATDRAPQQRVAGTVLAFEFSITTESAARRATTVLDPVGFHQRSESGALTISIRKGLAP